MTCATAGLRCDAPLRDIARRGCALLGGWCAMEQRDPYGPLRCECACDPPPCRCRVERGACAAAAKHRGAAGITAEWQRYSDGAVELRLRYPTGHAPGATMLDAVRWGLRLVRGALANARWLRERNADAPCTCGVGEGTGHAWACERVWCEQGTAREALRGDGR